MKYFFIFNVVISLLTGIQGSAQHTVTIEITGRPQLHADEPFFITGSFQRWQPDEPKWQVKKNKEGIYTITIENAPRGLFEYKFTRGNWKTLESTEEGRLAAPRRTTLSADTLIQCTIEGWRDDFPASTASPQVTVMDTAFFIPQLQRTRRVWMYLPEDYASSRKSYPVLYMHDGQDLFDEATSEGRIGPLEWSVDETIDGAKKKCIVIAVEHHVDKKMRIKEYYVHGNPDTPDVEGAAYLDFIVKTLKPFVDKKYRTHPDKKNTFMAGSSMGGLLTFYAGLTYPEVFGSLGILSPSVWLDNGYINRELEQLKPHNSIRDQRYYFYAGTNENRQKPDGSLVRMHEDVELVSKLLKEKANPEIHTAICPDGRHGAWYWRQAFPDFYKWLTK